MNNYKLLIQYDGTKYNGWQYQLEKPTIQKIITEAIEVLIKERIILQGAGRTDSGVHAWGQVANFKCLKELDLYRFSYSLNSVLPKDIAIKKICKVSEDFNARFDARKRSYVYLIIDYKSPFYNRFSFYYTKKANIDLLNDYAKILIGKYDFTSFSKKSNEEINKECHIYNAVWKQTKGFTLFYIEADRFLHGMVRAIVGTQLELEKANKDKSCIEKILLEKNREAAGVSIPARGLFLYKVQYKKVQND